MLKEREVVLKVTVNTLYDTFDQEELKQLMIETLKKDHWDCVALEVEEVKPEQIYNR